LLALQTNEFIITINATFVLLSEILVKNLFGTEMTEKRQEDLYATCVSHLRGCWSIAERSPTLSWE